MSLPMKAIDRLFERLAATYGADWLRQWRDVPMADVKAAWGHELGGYSERLTALAWALENLPEKCPNVIQFKRICESAPMPEAPRLPEPKADPERLRAELSKLGDIKARIEAQGVDGREWARRIVGRHKEGYRFNPTTLLFARQALRSCE